MAEAASKPRMPSRLRFALLVGAAVYPLITLILEVVLALTPGWPLPARTAVVVPIMVSCMVWGIIPFIQTRLRHWL